MNSRTGFFTMLVVLVVGLSAGFAQTTATGSDKSKFQPQDVEFPKVNGWTLGAKTPLPGEESGFAVNYDSPDEERMTVYIYSRGQSGIPNELSGVIKDEFDGAIQALKTVAEMGYYSNLKVAKTDTASVGGANGKVKALHALLTFEAGGTKFNSEVYVFPYKNHVVKLRISRPATLPADSETYLKLLMAIDGVFSK